MSKLRQMALDLCFRDEYVLENFYSESNRELFSILNNIDVLPLAKFLYLYGNKSSGRSHILMALSNKFKDNGKRAVYLPLLELSAYSVEILDNLDDFDIICIDDLDTILNNRFWEEAFFAFFNKISENKAKLVVSAMKAPNALDFVLPDLKSRMMSGIVYKINSLTDEDKVNALQMRAQFLGLDLPEASALFLVNNCSRDNAALFTILKKLDEASLQEKRRLTVPFVRSILQKI